MFPFENVILINRASKTPIYKQIAYAISSAIQSGVLLSGTQLPGSRELAKKLVVHRKTVIAAYDELNAQNWIDIVPRKHVFVSHKIPLITIQHLNKEKIISSYDTVFSLPFKEFNDVCKPKIKTLPHLIIDDGHPDVRLSPIDDLLKNYRSLTSKKHTIKNAQIGADQGTIELREQIVTYLSETRGLNISTDNLLITHGAQMCIYIVTQLILRKDSNIIVGYPNYALANQTFKESGANLIEVPVDECGIDVAAIENICKNQKITAVYIIPHHHYPTTVTLSAERRRKLLELSQAYMFTIIEDDYDYEYHYDSSPYLPLAGFPHMGNIIYIGSFSKILDPSLRIGFLVAPNNFIMECTAFRRTIDVGGDGYMQNALATLIKESELNRHIKKAKKIYHQRRDYLDKKLKENLAKYILYTLPSGGMAIWITLYPEYPISLLTENKNLTIIRAYKEFNSFRFGFASMNEKEIDELIELIKNILKTKDLSYMFD